MCRCITHTTLWCFGNTVPAARPTGRGVAAWGHWPLSPGYLANRAGGVFRSLRFGHMKEQSQCQPKSASVFTHPNCRGDRLFGLSSGLRGSEVPLRTAKSRGSCVRPPHTRDGAIRSSAHRSFQAVALLANKLRARSKSARSSISVQRRSPTATSSELVPRRTSWS